MTYKDSWPRSSRFAARYCYWPRHNTSLIDAQVFALLREHALLRIAPRVLPPGTDILIPSTQPDAGKTTPAYWVITKSNLLTGDHVARILDAFASALEVSTRPRLQLTSAWPQTPHMGCREDRRPVCLPCWRLPQALRL
jgi:hypothetical protein